jgi:hypothetical protein
MTRLNRYSLLIQHVFFSNYKSGDREVRFSRSELVEAAKELGIILPKNLGDVIYSFRYRTNLPDRILREAPEGEEWVIMPAGRSQYVFTLTSIAKIVPRDHLSKTKIPDATPGMIERYSLTDEQALLAKVRYNRLVDIFTGLTCYSLQNHLRTYVDSIGQVETDEVYIGIDKAGAHYVLPVQAKGSSDYIGIIQIEQDFRICEEKFPDLIPIPIAGQFIAEDQIALFTFQRTEGEITIASERHYSLVPPDELTKEELEGYRSVTQSR